MTKPFGTDDETADGTRWRAVALGWAVAVLVGIVISTLLRLLYGSLLGPEVERGSLSPTVVVVSLVAGFLSYLMGGFLAARSARYSGRKHGALAAFVGLTTGVVLTLILTPFEAVFAEGVALPPSCFGAEGDSLLAGLALFAANLFGGLIGGTMGEPLRADG
ncbi:MAG: hypothetical protein CYG60_06530 [Actinobacteria bacterium]|nr:MAG: hypothetical protein CYG60_06530 [Actinomycetota bacterium]